MLDSNKGRTVEDFLKQYPEVQDHLDIGGDKMRFTYLSIPPDNYEEYIIMSRYRIYRLYFYVSDKGIIYDTDYQKAYLDQNVRESVVTAIGLVALAGIYEVYKEATRPGHF